MGSYLSNPFQYSTNELSEKIEQLLARREVIVSQMDAEERAAQQLYYDQGGEGPIGSTVSSKNLEMIDVRIARLRDALAQARQLNGGKRLSQKLFLSKNANDLIMIKRSTIPNAGKGAFARRLITQGEHLGNYMGEKCSRESNGDYVLDVEVTRKYDGMPHKVHICLDAKNLQHSNWTRYINSVTKDTKHKENVQFYVHGEKNKERIGIRAIKNIKEGGELFLDYGDEYF